MQCPPPQIGVRGDGFETNTKHRGPRRRLYDWLILAQRILHFLRNGSHLQLDKSRILMDLISVRDLASNSERQVNAENRIGNIPMSPSSEYYCCAPLASDQPQLRCLETKPRHVERRGFS